MISMFDKINIISILTDHINTLRNYRTNKYKIFDLILFFLIPLPFSIILTYIYGITSNTLITIFSTSLSIFAALLFNLLLLIYDIVRNKDENTENHKLKMTFLKEIYSNISFSILVAISTVVISLFIALIDKPKTDIQKWIIYILSIVIYYLTSIFILTFLMVLKRVHVLLSKEFEHIQ